ncbi:MAG: hypothetical protein ACI9VR_002220 [Cognaticolwellia sp.]|jgi:hypothetical protein
MTHSIPLYTPGMLVLFFLACLAPLPIVQTGGDRDGDGVPAGVDCDDNNAGLFPGNPEVCDDKDQDCDGIVDEGSFLDGYVDQDGDGVGAGEPIQVCDVFEQGFVFDGNDCDDGDPETFPGAQEACDGQDNDCDDAVDEGVDYDTYYMDSDGDGYGDHAEQRDACGDPPEGYARNNQDCDDSDSGVNPGAEELCDGLDQDCSGDGPDSVEECSCEIVRYNDSPFLYCGDHLSWFNARDSCIAMDTDLLTVDGFNTNRAAAAIAEAFEVDLWTGLSDYASEGNWTWADGSAVSYTNWASGEPNNAGNDEDCMEVGYYATGRWNDNRCSSQHPFMCTYNGLAPE